MLSFIKKIFKKQEVEKPVFRLTNIYDDMFCLGKVTRVEFDPFFVRVVISKNLQNCCTDSETVFRNIPCNEEFKIGEVVAIVNRGARKLNSVSLQGIKFNIRSIESNKTTYTGKLQINGKACPLFVEIDTMMEDKEITIDIDKNGTLSLAKGN